LTSKFPDVQGDLLSLIFITALDSEDFDLCFSYIKKTENEKQKADFLRIFISKVIRAKAVRKLLEYDFKDLLSFLTNDLMCYSVKTLLVAALFYNKIGDVSETAAALYLFARTLLRMVTEENLRKAASALVLCLSVTEDRDFVIRSVSDNALVDRKSIEKILKRVVCMLEIPGISDNIGNSEILQRLYEIGSDKVCCFGQLSSFEELCGFCEFIIVRKDFLSLSKILRLDKRKWGYKLHCASLENVLKLRYDPPVWMVEAFIANSMRDFFVLCIVYDRKKIVKDVVDQMFRKGMELNHHLVRLLVNSSLEQSEDTMAKLSQMCSVSYAMPVLSISDMEER
jgi:hypothetical protein